MTSASLADRAQPGETARAAAFGQNPGRRGASSHLRNQAPAQERRLTVA